MRSINYNKKVKKEKEKKNQLNRVEIAARLLLKSRRVELFYIKDNFSVHRKC